MPDNNDKEHIGAIVKARTLALQKTSSNLARRAIQDIDRLTTDPHVSKLIRRMSSSSDLKEREYAWIELRKMGPTYRGWAESLRNMIYTDDGWSRIFSAEALSRFSCNPEDALPVLAATLDATIETQSNDWATVASGAIWQYREYAQNFDAYLIDVLISALNSSEEDVKGYSAATLGHVGGGAQKALLSLASLFETTKHAKLKATCLHAMQQIDPSVTNTFESYIAALRIPDTNIRGQAVCEIAKLGSGGITAIPELLLLSNDESFDVRRFLAIALGKLGQRTAEIVSVLNTLTHDPDDSVKVGAFYSLVRLGENQQGNLNSVLGFLSHNNPFVRHLSVWAVGEIGSIDMDNTISCLTHAIRQEDHPRNRDLMAESIEKLKRC
ncbi:MAG: HEAT repeat domain-containing protein [Sedimentisphaerales bacterium]